MCTTYHNGVTRDVTRELQRESRYPDPTRPDPTIKELTKEIPPTHLSRGLREPKNACAREAKSEVSR